MLPLALLAAAAAAATPAGALPPIALKNIMQALSPDCGRGSTGEVVVCGRDKQRSHYRIPAEMMPDGFQVDGPVDSVSRERHKLMDVGAAGTGSCSNTGAGGWTGCMVNDWRRDEQQRGFRSPGDVKP